MAAAPSGLFDASDDSGGRFLPWDNFPARFGSAKDGETCAVVTPRRRRTFLAEEPSHTSVDAPLRQEDSDEDLE
ncbi:hypothetical protein [Methylobacterium sp. P1-11]|uniref:hypothetical protein n=1 Tax=Methylobacterium sp. P1-11 TaxID=2024616 RepID=UPI0011EDF027|nr:hypothetical protein [Methylobacterium sp. P1-11]